MKEFGELFSPNDPELITKTLARLTEQDKWNDIFSTKLIELLDKIDQIKAEIRERQRRVDERIQQAESVTQAESALQQKCADFGNLAEQLEIARAAEKQAGELAANAKQCLQTAQEHHDRAADKLRAATAQLENARIAETHAADLAASANRYLQMAQERHNQAAAKLKTAAAQAESAHRVSVRLQSQAARIIRFAIYAIALSWLAMVWTIPIMSRTTLGPWLSATFSVVIVVIVLLFARRVDIANTIS